MISNAPPLTDRLAIQYEPLAAEIANALAGLAEPVIADDASAQAIGSKTADLIKLGKKVEKARKTEKDEFLAAGKTVDKFFQDMAAGLQKIIATMDGAVRAFQQKRHEEALAKEAREREVAVLFDAPAPDPIIAAAPMRIKAETGETRATARVDWKHEVVNVHELPRDLMMADEAKIKARVAYFKSAGKIEDAKIPGVRIFEVVTPIYR